MIRWLEETGGQEADSVGKKAAALAELNDKGIEVPRGFIVTVEAWEKFKEYNGIEDRIEKHLERARKGDMEDLQEASKRIRSIVRNSNISGQMKEDIKQAYEDINLSKKVRNGPDQAAELIGSQRELEFVAVRQSRKDVFPDLNHAELNVHGKSKLVEKIKEVWAEAYSPESLYMSQVKEKNLNPAVLVQRMVEAEQSASILTTDPTGQDEDLIIEAVHGIGSPLVRGNIQPERYRVERNNGRLKEQRTANMDWRLQTNQRTGQLEKQRIPRRERNENILSHDKITDIANLGLNIENMVGQPIHAVIAVEDDKNTVLSVQNTPEPGERNNDVENTEHIARGTPAAPGAVSGRSARYRNNESGRGNIALLDDLEELDSFLPEEVDRIGGAITTKGGLGSKISSYFRGLGKPLILDLEDLEELDGRNISIDGFKGTISDKRGKESGEESQIQEDPASPSEGLTGTKILTIGTEVQGADGVVEKDTIEGFHEGTYIIDRYSNVLKLEEIIEKGVGHLILDLDRLREEDRGATGRALKQTVELVGRENVSVVLREPSNELLNLIVEIGVESVIVPPASFDNFQRQLNRAERKFIMERLREERGQR